MTLTFTIKNALKAMQIATFGIKIDIVNNPYTYPHITKYFKECSWIQGSGTAWFYTKDFQEFASNVPGLHYHVIAIESILDHKIPSDDDYKLLHADLRNDGLFHRNVSKDILKDMIEKKPQKIYDLGGADGWFMGMVIDGHFVETDNMVHKVVIDKRPPAFDDAVDSEFEFIQTDILDVEWREKDRPYCLASSFLHCLPQHVILILLQNIATSSGTIVIVEPEKDAALSARLNDFTGKDLLTCEVTEYMVKAAGLQLDYKLNTGGWYCLIASA
jgi:hypothetical protein